MSRLECALQHDWRIAGPFNTAFALEGVDMGRERKALQRPRRAGAADLGPRRRRVVHRVLRIGIDSRWRAGQEMPDVAVQAAVMDDVTPHPRRVAVGKARDAEA